MKYKPRTTDDWTRIIRLVNLLSKLGLKSADDELEEYYA